VSVYPFPSFGPPPCLRQTSFIRKNSTIKVIVGYFFDGKIRLVSNPEVREQIIDSQEVRHANEAACNQVIKYLL
jgi:hypothetical protein